MATSLPAPTDEPDPQEEFAKLRGLTPEQNYAERTLYSGLPLTTQLEAYSVWLSAGAGAALVVLAPKEVLDMPVHRLWMAAPAGFLLASLAFAAIAKGFAYLASVQQTVIPSVVKNLAHLRKQVGEENFGPAVANATKEFLSRTRIPGRWLAKWGAYRGRKDPLAMAVISSAASQYVVCCIVAQVLCILNAAERIALRF